MLIPSKHERLEKNLLVIGADILSCLKKQKIWNIESLFQHLKETKKINLRQFYNCMTFLWLSEMIEVDKVIVLLRNHDVTK